MPPYGVCSKENWTVATWLGWRRQTEQCRARRDGWLCIVPAQRSTRGRWQSPPRAAEASRAFLELPLLSVLQPVPQPCAPAAASPGTLTVVCHALVQSPGRVIFIHFKL